MPDTPTSPFAPAPSPPAAPPAAPAPATTTAEPEAAKAPAKRYRLRTGVNYPDGKGGEKRAEIGDVVDDLPAESVAWLLSDGHIEEE